MGDLISRQAAIKAIEDLQDCYNGFSDTYDKACIIGVIEEVPSIEAEPIKHGHWAIMSMYEYRCSLCGAIHTRTRTNYCPNCGADMRGGENE